MTAEAVGLGAAGLDGAGPAPPAGYVTFLLAGRRYATSLLDVREVVRLAELLPVPGMVAPLAGVLDVRGASLPVVDLRPAGAAGSDAGNVLVLTGTLGTGEAADAGRADQVPAVGIVCDRVVAVVPAATFGVDPGWADGVGRTLPGYVVGLLRDDEGPVPLVNLRWMAVAFAVPGQRSAPAPAPFGQT